MYRAPQKERLPIAASTYFLFYLVIIFSPSPRRDGTYVHHIGCGRGGLQAFLSVLT
jgi:hypothetical protein